MKVRAICFDLDNTLWDVWPVIMRAEQRMYDFLAQRYPKAVASMTSRRCAMRASRLQLDYPQMAHDFTFLRRQALREHARACGYAERCRGGVRGLHPARNEVDLYDDVARARAARIRYRLFTASNGNADLTRSVSRTSSSAQWPRATSARSSPIRWSFTRSSRGRICSRRKCCYVGDDPDLDVEGAARAGMQPDLDRPRRRAIWPDTGIAAPCAHRSRTASWLGLGRGLQ